MFGGLLYKRVERLQQCVSLTYIHDRRRNLRQGVIQAIHGSVQIMTSSRQVAVRSVFAWRWSLTRLHHPPTYASSEAFQAAHYLNSESVKMRETLQHEMYLEQWR